MMRYTSEAQKYVVTAADYDLPPFGNEQVHLCSEATERQTSECVSARYTRTHKPKSKDFRSELSDITPEKSSALKKTIGSKILL